MGNSHILSELAHQGATLAELSQALRKASTYSVGDSSKTLPPDTDKSERNLEEEQQTAYRQRAMSLPTLTQASSPDFLEAHTRRKSPIKLEASDPASSIPRNRMSWANRLRSSPLSFVFKLPPWGLQPKGGERDEEVEGPIESSHRSPSSPPPAYADIEVIGNEESTGDSMAFQETTCSESDHSESNTSVSPGVDTGKPLPKTPAISSQLLQSSHAENSLKDGIPVPMINKNGPKLLLEMLMPAKSARFDEVVPFESFGELNSMSYNASFRGY